MDQIQTQLTSLKLSGMAKSWQSLIETRQSSELSLIDGLQLLLQSEQDQRLNNRNGRLLKNAKFRYQASIEEIIHEPTRGLDKSLLAHLVTGDYIKNGEAVIITGAAGCGKSYLASALGNNACRKGYRVAYFNMQKLLTQLKLARLDGTIIKLFDKFAKADLLILDDFGLVKLESGQQVDFLEMIEDRHAKKATIIVSQLPVGSWFDVIGNESIADAVLDRIVHTAHRFELRGESMRKKH